MDEFTGRVLAGRRWADGLHQAVEAKEGVQIKGEMPLATIISQNDFRMFHKLAGMNDEIERLHELGHGHVYVAPSLAGAQPQLP